MVWIVDEYVKRSFKSERLKRVKKKLLFTIINMNRGGGQRVLVNLVNSLDLQKYDITVLAINGDGDLHRELKDGIHYKAIVRCKHKFIHSLHSFVIRRVVSPKIIASHYIDNDFDYEVAYLEGECTRLIAAHKNDRCKKIAWVHVNLLAITGSFDLYKSMDEARNVYKQFNRVICVSKGVKDAFIKCFGFSNNVSVIYNSFDEKEIAQKAQEIIKPWRGNGLNILMVGNVRKEKAYDRMMSVCEKLKREGLCFSVTILGGGAELKTIENLRKEKGLDEVHMLGPISNPYPYMKQADVLVCSSLQEGFSTVVIEALLLNLPTITTRCAGMDEILDGGKYGIITENDENALYLGIKQIIQNPEILDHYRTALNERKAFFSRELRIKETERLFE